MVKPGSPDYYQILGGISPTATQEEIKKMYKQMSLKLHPDKNPSPNATMMFQDLQESYSVLNDPEKRRQYDRYYYYAESDEEEEDEKEDEEDYEEDSEDDYFECECGYCHRTFRPSFMFSSFFNELFSRYNQRHGYEEPPVFHAKGNGWIHRDRFAADWDSLPKVPTKEEIVHNNAPDKPSKPKVVYISQNNCIQIEWAKKNPRKAVTHYIVERRIGSSTNWTVVYNGSDSKECRLENANVYGGETLYFRIKAGNSTGTSEASDITSISIPRQEINKSKHNHNPTIPSTTSTLEHNHSTTQNTNLKKSYTSKTKSQNNNNINNNSHHLSSASKGTNQNQSNNNNNNNTSNSNHMNGSKQKKKGSKHIIKNGINVTKMIKDLELAIQIKDYEQLQKLDQIVTKHIEKLNEYPELFSLISKSQTLVYQKSIIEEMEGLLSNLQQALKTEDLTSIQKTINELNEFESSNEQTLRELQKFDALEEEIKTSQMKLTELKQLIKKRETITKELEKAKAEKNLEKLNQAIEKAKECGISIRHVKKVLRILQREQAVKDKLKEGIANKDRKLLEETLERLKNESNFEMGDELHSLLESSKKFLNQSTKKKSTSSKLQENQDLSNIKLSNGKEANGKKGKVNGNYQLRVSKSQETNSSTKVSDFQKPLQTEKSIPQFEVNPTFSNQKDLNENSEKIEAKPESPSNQTSIPIQPPIQPPSTIRPLSSHTSTSPIIQPPIQNPISKPLSSFNPNVQSPVYSIQPLSSVSPQPSPFQLGFSQGTTNVNPFPGQSLYQGQSPLFTNAFLPAYVPNSQGIPSQFYNFNNSNCVHQNSFPPSPFSPQTSFMNPSKPNSFYQNPTNLNNSSMYLNSNPFSMPNPIANMQSQMNFNNPNPPY